GYNFARHLLPHDGDADTLSNVTPKKQMQDAFPNCTVRIVQRPSKKMVAINAVRTILDVCNLDEEKTSDLWACLCNYAYKENEHIKQAKDFFKRASSWEGPARVNFEYDYKFANGDTHNKYQWDNDIVAARELDDKPCLTINKVQQHNLMVINDAKQNKPGV